MATPISLLEEKCKKSAKALNTLEGLITWRGVKTTDSLPTLDIDDLEPCDLLLSYGKGCIARLVRIFDRCEYSHTALFDGKELLEARMSGVSKREMKGQEFSDFLIKNICYTHVYRVKDWKSAGIDKAREKVISVAHQYAKSNAEFDLAQLFTLTTLVLVRQIPSNPLMKGYAYKYLGEIIELLTSLWSDRDKVEAMVCSEYVYRCFVEALPGRQNPLQLLHGINYREARKRLAFEMRKLHRWLGMKARREFHQLSVKVLSEKSPLVEVLKQIEDSPKEGLAVAPDFVTSGDICTCPNLELVGRLDYGVLMPEEVLRENAVLCG